MAAVHPESRGFWVIRLPIRDGQNRVQLDRSLRAGDSRRFESFDLGQPGFYVAKLTANVGRDKYILLEMIAMTLFDIRTKLFPVHGHDRREKHNGWKLEESLYPNIPNPSTPATKMHSTAIRWSRDRKLPLAMGATTWSGSWAKEEFFDVTYYTEHRLREARQPPS